MSNLVRRRVGVTISNANLPVYLPSKTMGTIQTVAVTLEDEDGNKGFGYSYFINKDEVIKRATQTAIELATASNAELARLANIERIEERLYGKASDMATKGAANALSVATWDLIGRQLNTPCYRLWQGSGEPMACFRSGYHWDTAESSAEEKAQAARDANFGMVKVLVGQTSPAIDADRIRRIQTVFPEPNTVIADAFWNWSPAEASAFSAAVETPLLWFEDPVAYELLHEVKTLHSIGTGESLGETREFIDIALRGADRAIIDLGRIGGPVRFLEAARLLNTLGVKVGSHVYSHQSLHLLSALAMPAPVEMLDWWDPFYLDNPAPDSSGKLKMNGPGFGVQPNFELINRSNNIAFRIKR